MQGLSHAFSRLRSLVIFNSNHNHDRGFTFDNLHPVIHLASTLEHLELRGLASFQGQTSTALNHHLHPFSKLANLKNLYISRLTNASCETMKAIENLTNLRHLFYEGHNHTSSVTSTTSSMSCPLLLDLSKITQIKSLTFINCHFCSELELRTDVQALRLPAEERRRVTCAKLIEEVENGFHL